MDINNFLRYGLRSWHRVLCSMRMMSPEQFAEFKDMVTTLLEDTCDKYGAARAIGMSVSWVDKHVDEIPHHRIGKRIIFSRKACREWSRAYGRGGRRD